MSFKKLVMLSSMAVAALAGPARGDAILTLGFFSDNATSTPPAYAASTSSSSSLNLASSDPTNQVAPVAMPTTSYTPPAPQSPPSASPSYDAYINFQNGGFADSGSLTTGNAQAWYNSPNIVGLFGGLPNAQQIGNFDATVLQRVEQTFQLSGVPVNLTADPSANAAHMLSVVSNTVNPTMNNAIGMTNIGGNGFSFIDNSAKAAGSVDQLEWIVAHNVAHELMLAFGVPEVHDQTGQYIDSTVGSMAMFLNPSATFSSGAVQDLLSRNFQQSNGAWGLSLQQAQLLGSSTVPEPTTWAVWGLGAVALMAARKARSRRASA